MPDRTSFLAGVIEGFYGPPWAQADRLTLFDRMAAWGLNTYFYCPKDDLKQRALWRETYSGQESGPLTELIAACRQRNLRFFYALSPGLDIRYSQPEDADHLKRRFEQMLGFGCGNFALLFDDIPDRLDAGDLGRHGSLAAAQSHVTNAVFDWVRQRAPDARFLFCPTPYCGRMASAGLGGADYLETIGRELRAGIDILWTGPEIISREITVPRVDELSRVLRRKPLIWDNLHANDYDGRRFFCGPYSGRPRELCDAVAGILSNPNCEFPLNFVPIHTLAAFVNGAGPWTPREAYLAAMREWLPRFETCRGPMPLEDVVLLGDCHYLPHEDGVEAEVLFDEAKRLLARLPSSWGEDAVAFRRRVARLRDLCARTAELLNRPLFYALSRRVWELREEMDLLDRYVAFKASGQDTTAEFGSDFHLPGTFRGSLVARLERLLVQQPGGGFTTAADQP